MTNLEKKLRCFFAIEANDELRQAADIIIHDLRQQLSNYTIKWSPLKNLHLTLRFLGEIVLSQLADALLFLQEQLKLTRPFKISPGNLIVFPTHHTQVIAITIKLTEELLNLSQLLEQTVMQAGLLAEKHGFLPHITLGRIHSHTHIKLDNNQHKLSVTQTVKYITLFQSQINDKGSIYLPLQKFYLGN